MIRKVSTAVVLGALTGAALGGGSVVESSVLAFATIPDDDAQGVTVTLPIDAPVGSVVTGVTLALDLRHDWVGDLRLELVSPQGASVVLLDRAGLPNDGFPGPFGCGGRDIDAVFDDSAVVLGQDVCSTSEEPVITGGVRPVAPMSALDGVGAPGAWVLKVSDRSAFDTGVVIEATLTLGIELACLADLDGSGSLNFGDVTEFLTLYGNGDLGADLDSSGTLNFGDVTAYLTLYAQGCP